MEIIKLIVLQDRSRNTWLDLYLVEYPGLPLLKLGEPKVDQL